MQTDVQAARTQRRLMRLPRLAKSRETPDASSGSPDEKDTARASALHACDNAAVARLRRREEELGHDPDRVLRTLHEIGVPDVRELDQLDALAQLAHPARAET
jgi:hypothetical protein